MVNLAVRDKTWFSLWLSMWGVDIPRELIFIWEGGQNKAPLCAPYSSDKLVPATSSNGERGRGGEVIWSLYATADERSRQQPEMKPGRCTKEQR